mgnify:CR=1 FL=1
MMAEEKQLVRIRIIIQEQVKGRYKPNSSRNISIFDNASVDEVQTIILNALARYGIKHKYTWYNKQKSGSREFETKE